jgi:hypothetical protein
MGVAGRLGTLAEPGFRLLFVGRATSELGSALVPVALAFAVIEQLRSTDVTSHAAS